MSMSSGHQDRRRAFAVSTAEDQVVARHPHGALHDAFRPAGLFGVVAEFRRGDAELWIDVSKDRPQHPGVQPLNAKLEEAIQNALLIARCDCHAGSLGLVRSTRRKSSARIAP